MCTEKYQRKCDTGEHEGAKFIDDYVLSHGSRHGYAACVCEAEAYEPKCIA